MYICVYACFPVYFCMYIYLYMCIYIYIYVCIYSFAFISTVYTYRYMYVSMYPSIYLCLYLEPTTLRQPGLLKRSCGDAEVRRPSVEVQRTVLPACGWGELGAHTNLSRAVQELKLSHHSSDTLVFAIYPSSGNLKVPINWIYGI